MNYFYLHNYIYVQNIKSQLKNQIIFGCELVSKDQFDDKTKKHLKNKFNPR